MTSLSRGYSTFVSTPATSQGSSDGLYRLPLMAAAMGLGYNSSLFSNHSATNTLILDSAAMAAMWTGDLVDWNDSRIAALNPWLGLPAGQLALVYCDDLLGEGDVLARYLSNISSTLAAQLSAPGNFSNLAPVLSGRAVAACTPADKAMALARPDMAASLVPMMLPDLTAAALGSARMRNAAGVAVAPSTASVTQALTLSEASLDLTNLGGTAWPLSTMVFAVVQTQLSSSDCSLVKELMSFVSWMQINDQAANAITASGHTPLDRIHRQNMLDTLTNVTCNGKKSLTTAFLSGMGPLIPNYESWATDYETSSFKLKYYTSSSLDAIEAMIEGSVDFGSSGSVLPAEQQALMPDMKLIPVVAYGYVFAYNIPSLRETEALVIDFQTASDIYLNKVPPHLLHTPCNQQPTKK
jgi:ABC-type phosphate transport system substrate-binding protein